MQNAFNSVMATGTLLLSWIIEGWMAIPVHAVYGHSGIAIRGVYKYLLTSPCNSCSREYCTFVRMEKQHLV